VEREIDLEVINKRFRAVLLAGVAISVGTSVPAAFADTVYPAAAAFQQSWAASASAVAGQFEFGYYSDSLTPPFSPLIPFDEASTITDGGSLEFWQSSTVQNSLVPAAFYNDTGSTVVFGTVTLEPYQLAFHPGFTTDTVIRFTAPSAGKYSFSAAFEGADTSGNTNTTLEVVQNNDTVLGSGAVTGYHNITYAFDQTVYLGAGGYLDFLVNNNGQDDYQSTALIPNLTVTAVPLPAAAGMGFSILGGCGALAMLRKRFNRGLRIA